MEFKLVPVPPPEVAPEQATAKALGLHRGLKVDKTSSQWRCCNCHTMQRSGSLLVWVADGVRIGDPEWAVTENERVNAYNGTGSGWCLKCAQRLCAPPVLEQIFSPRDAPYRPWWKFW